MIKAFKAGSIFVKLLGSLGLLGGGRRRSLGSSGGVLLLDGRVGLAGGARGLGLGRGPESLQGVSRALTESLESRDLPGCRAGAA